MSKHEKQIHEDEIRVPDYDPGFVDRTAGGSSPGGQNLNYYQRMQAEKARAAGRPYGDEYSGSRRDPYVDRRSQGRYEDYPEDPYYPDPYEDDEGDYAPGDDYDFGRSHKKKKKKTSDRDFYEDRGRKNRPARYADYEDRDRKKKKKKGHPFLRFLRTLLIVIAILAIVAFAVVKIAFSRLNRVDPIADTTADQATAAAGVSTYSQDGVMNILLIGQDARAGESQTRSDTMIICSLNSKTHQISLTSLMRDMYVPMAGYGYNDKLNAAYALGGMETLDETIQEDFGIDIDGNAVIDLNGFLEAITSVGNLDIELSQEEADYMNQHPEMGSDEDKAEEVWELHAGMNSLTPSQVLGYARMRYVGNSDWDRTTRQRKVIQTAFSKVKKNPLKLLGVMFNAAPAVTTDMTDGYLLQACFYTLLCGTDMQTNLIPGEGQFYADNIDGAAVLVPDLDACRQALIDYIYQGKGQVSQTTLPASTTDTQDNDSLDDQTEVDTNEIDPTTGEPWPDLDGDGIGDVDMDHDGIPDAWGDNW